MTADATSTAERPHISIILPLYNRSRFLPAAFDAIRSQQMPSYEIVVVDDGSTDDTSQVIAQLAPTVSGPVRYITQANQGAYGARNTGIREAHGHYISFYDSDDVWLPHHLPNCVAALDQNPDVDWVYSASEIVDLESGTMLDPNCFRVNGGPRPFMRLQHQTRGALHVISDRGAIRCQIDHGLYCGLQNSVMRRRVFERLTLEAASRNEAEDQLFAIRALDAGFTLAYFDAIHVRYHVHADNSSGASKDISLQKRRRVYEPLIAGYERLRGEVALSADDTRALNRRIAYELFWHLGYSGYWVSGARREALSIYQRAIQLSPWDLRQWKTYILAWLRTRVA